MKLLDGFYPALGTPLDGNGNVIKESMERQIGILDNAGASGYLTMGSMGIGPMVKSTEFSEVARAASEFVGGRSPVFVGCMENSLGRVRERFDALKGMKIDGVVLTTPYYFVSNERDLRNFFTAVCEISPYPVYLYDLPGVTKMKITLPLVRALMPLRGVAGIKSGDLVLMRDLLSCDERCEKRDDFSLFFSQTELFDVAYEYGLTKQLDGFFCCIPKLTRRFYGALAAGDADGSRRIMNEINDFRNYLFTFGIFPAFTLGMNLLGCEGNFHPDYYLPLDDEAKERVIAKFREIGEVD